jgi:hypothetical protein
MNHHEIEAKFGIKPGERCEECGVPITANQIVDDVGPAVTFGGSAYHNWCAPDEAFEGIREDTASIEADRARREGGY